MARSHGRPTSENWNLVFAGEDAVCVYGTTVSGMSSGDSFACCGGNCLTEEKSLPCLLDGKEKNLRGDCGNDTDKQYSMRCEDSSKLGKRRSKCCNSIAKSVWGIILILFSICGFIFPPLDLMLWERLNMRPGFPAYEWWLNPPGNVTMKAYIFNVTNHERFLQGLDSKINVNEVGPFVYLEKLKHYNVKFNDNSTLTYTAERSLVYLPDENTIDFNETVVVPNLALLGMSSYLHNENYFIRSALKRLASWHGSEFFVKKTIYEYLWENKESLLDTVGTLVPGRVPNTNMGMLKQIYADFVDEVTVKIGPKWGHQDFFKIEYVRGMPHIKGYKPNECPDRLTGATEGVLFHQHLSKDEILHCLRKSVCRVLPLYFDTELTIHGLTAYRYNLSESAFNRVKNGTDCYDAPNPLPDGMSDTSKCFYDFPLVASYPHFYTGSPTKDRFVTGLKPDKYKHNSYMVMEPITGTPFDAVARLQSNLQINNMSSFDSTDYERFSNLILPLGWIEYRQEILPRSVRYTVYFMVMIVPYLSIFIFMITLLLGFYLITKQLIVHNVKKNVLQLLLNLKKHKVDNLAINKESEREKEIFLKKRTEKHGSR